MSDIVRRRVVVSGLVQGVGFRYRTVQEAARIGVTGDVTNRADGTVLVHVEGAADDVDRLLAWFRAGGAPSARVDSVEVAEEPSVGATSFEIV